MRMRSAARTPWLVLGLGVLLVLGACAAADTDGADMPEIRTPHGGASGEVAETETGRPESKPTETAAEDQRQSEETSTPVVDGPAELPAAPTGAPESTAASEEDEYEMVTLLPLDGIPSIDSPNFYEAAEADEEYHPLEMVLGVEADGEARAYPIGLLSRHEIVNDTVADQPIAVTW